MNLASVDMVSQLDAKDKLLMMQTEIQKNGYFHENHSAVLSVGSKTQQEIETLQKGPVENLSQGEPNCWQLWHQVTSDFNRRLHTLQGDSLQASEKENNMRKHNENNSSYIDHPVFPNSRIQYSCGNGHLYESPNQSRDNQINMKNNLHMCDAFKKKSPLSELIKTLTARKLQECNECGKHIGDDFTEPLPLGENPHPRSECARDFSHTSGLPVPLSVLTGERWSRQHSHLQTPQRIHTGENLAKCHESSYSVNKNSFHCHQSNYTGKKSFRCDSCGKGFYSNRDLTVHYRTHTGEKPYKCRVW